MCLEVDGLSRVGSHIGFPQGFSNSLKVDEKNHKFVHKYTQNKRDTVASFERFSLGHVESLPCTVGAQRLLRLNFPLLNDMVG